MSWIDRLVGCAVGALVIGLLAALVGIGPERVLTGLLAVVAATLGGALLDDFIGSRTKSAWASRGRMPSQPVGQQPYSAPRGTTPALGANHPRGAALRRHPPVDMGLDDGEASASAASRPPRHAVGSQLASDVVPIEAPEPPMPPSRQSITPPEAHWVDARLPANDEPSSRWVAVGERDLIATYLFASTAPNAACTRCGRTVARPEGDVPSDCPIGERVSCPLRQRDNRLVTGFRSLSNVSRDEPSDPN
jgi:ribosomal protein S27E